LADSIARLARGVMNDTLLTNNLGDGSTLSLDFTTGILDPRLTFSQASGGTCVGPDGFIYWRGFRPPVRRLPSARDRSRSR
jgi:hypothetical protein